MDRDSLRHVVKDDAFPGEDRIGYGAPAVWQLRMPDKYVTLLHEVGMNEWVATRSQIAWS